MEPELLLLRSVAHPAVWPPGDCRVVAKPTYFWYMNDSCIHSGVQREPVIHDIPVTVFRPNGAGGGGLGWRKDAPATIALQGELFCIHAD
jgi:hypothetical protein